MILPAALRYQTDVAAAVNGAKAAGVEDGVQLDMLKELVGATSALRTSALALDAAIVEEADEGVFAHAKYMHDTIIPAMLEVRKWGDALEVLVSDNYWPLPTYREMLFIR